jgi:hypothetical protein
MLGGVPFVERKIHREALCHAFAQRCEMRMRLREFGPTAPFAKQHDKAEQMAFA